MRHLSLLLLLAACERPSHWTWVDECDPARSERVFLTCLQAAQNMGGPNAPGNDSDEVVESCRAAAESIACRRVHVCVERCVDGGTP